MSDSTPTNADALATLLSRFGVRRVIGEPLGDLPHIAVADPDLAVLLADADGRVNGGWGAAFIEDQILHVSSQPGGSAHPVECHSVTEVASVLAAEATPIPSTIALYLDLDLDAAAPPGEPDLDQPSELVSTLAPELADLDVAVLVGPGVARSGDAAVSGLDAFARHSGLAVANTFGSKGVFRWDSPFHVGTVGLQTRDLELAGFMEADLVVLSGLDPAEIDVALLADSLTIEVDPRQLAALAIRWDAASGPPEDRSELYRAVSEVLTPLYEDAGGPVNGARASLHLAGAAGERGVVVADAGPAGFWPARAFPTARVGSVVVCAVPFEGAAVAGALAATWEGRPALAVTHELGPMGEAVLGLARDTGAAMGVQVWAEDGESVDGDAHAARSVDQFAATEVTVARVAVATDVPDALVDAAGEVSAPFVAPPA